MTAGLEQARQQEQGAADLRPQPLRPHIGEEHFQNALDADSTYRQLVLGAIALAFFAGSGFGQLPLYAGWAPLALWCMTVAGFAAGCTAPRAGLRPGVVDNAALRSTLRLVAAATATGGALAGVLGGIAALMPLAAAIGIALFLFLISLEPKPGGALSLTTIVAFGIGAPLALAPAALADGIALLAGGGLAAAIAMIFTARASLSAPTVLNPAANGSEHPQPHVPRSPRKVNPALALTRLALLGWFVAMLGGRAGDHVLPLAIAITGLLVLHFVAIRRRSFVPTVAVVALAHLGPALALDATLHAALWAQLPAAIAEFLLLMAAGYRHVLAAPLRLPQATYRVAPLCIVPRLDRAWDHPVKINVA